MSAPSSIRNKETLFIYSDQPEWLWFKKALVIEYFIYNCKKRITLRSMDSAKRECPYNGLKIDRMR